MKETNQLRKLMEAIGQQDQIEEATPEHKKTVDPRGIHRNVDRRESCNTQLRDLHYAYRNLQLKYEADTYELRTLLLQANKELKALKGIMK